MTNKQNIKKSEFIEELIKKINLLYEIAKRNEQIPGIQGIISFNNDTNTTIKLINTEERKAYREVIDFILSYPNISANFSENYIRTQLYAKIHRLLSSEIDISEDLNNFYSSLIEDSNDEWLIVSEIENITLQQSTAFHLIDSIIKYNMNTDFPIDRKKYTGLMELDFLHKPCIYTTVKAGDSEKATLLALINFELSFALLRLYNSNARPTLKGSLPLGDMKLFIHNNTKNKGVDSDSVVGNIHSEFILNNDNYTHLIEEGIESLSNSTYEITEVIKTGLYWYKTGLNEDLPSAKLLNFVTILESSLKRKDEKDELKMRIADRCALLLGDNFENRKTIFKDISEIYTVRHGVVHKGVIIDDEKLVRKASIYARAVLRKLINVNSEYEGDFNKFITNIDNKKYLDKK